MLSIVNMERLNDWSFGGQDEENASPKIMLLPHLQELHICAVSHCWNSTKRSKTLATKSLHIIAVELKSLDYLPTKIEEPSLSSCINLTRVYCPLMLKKLGASDCKALSSVNNLDSLQELYFYDFCNEILPKWLLTLLRQSMFQESTNDVGEFLLKIGCHVNVLRACINGGSYWSLIQHILHVYYLCYSKQPYVYDTNL